MMQIIEKGLLPHLRHEALFDLGLNGRLAVLAADDERELAHSVVYDVVGGDRIAGEWSSQQRAQVAVLLRGFLRQSVVV